MQALFASGHVVDIALALTVIEAGLVTWYARRIGRGPAPGPFLGNLLSGVCLMLALRAALVGAWWGWIGFFLIGALAAHLSDLRWRWRR